MTNNPLHILLVEDSEVNQQLMSRILMQQGCQVTLADHGQMALDACRLQLFDLILMDIEMPVLNGIEATQRIRQLSAYQDTPIIALTGYTDASDIEQYLALGMSGHLGKPIDVNKLIDTIGYYFPESMPETGQTGQPAADADTRKISECPSDRLMDFAALVDTVGGKENFALHILQLFFKGVDELSPQLAAAINQGEKEVVRRVAHRIKGSMDNARLIAGREAIGELEKKADSLSSGDMQNLFQAWLAGVDAIHAVFMEKADAFMAKRAKKTNQAQ